MTIRFKCPHCQKPLSVKEHLAGKRAACPVCKKAITIPVPVPDPNPVDVEDFAAEAFADKAAAAPAEPSGAKTIDFTCPFCDEELKLGVDLAGKKAPCPKCTKVIKVPLLKEAKPKDWRTTQRGGPSAALANLPEQLADAWGTEQKGRVSREAMEEAGALPEPEAKPVSVATWVRRGVWTCVATGTLFVLVTFAVRAYRSSLEKNHLEEALKYLSELVPLHQVEVHRAIGEIQVRNERADEALSSFSLARSIAPAASEDLAPSFERDLVLVQLVLNQADMGGTGSDTFTSGQIVRRIDWSDGIVQREMLQTIEAIRTPGAKASALRALACKLMSMDQPDVAMSLAANVASANVANANMANTNVANPDATNPNVTQRSPFLAQQKGLQLARKEQDKEKDKEGEQDAYHIAAPEPGKPIADNIVRIAYTEGCAYKKEFGEALIYVRAPGPAQGRLEACVAAAAIALMKGSPRDAVPFIEEGLAACAELSQETKDKAAAWSVLELIRLGSRTDADVGRIKGLVDGLPSSMRPLAQLDIFRGYLDRNPTKAGEPGRVEDVGDDKHSVRALAWEALARHNARLGQTGAINIEEADKSIRPFVHLGIALGVQDRAQKK